MDENDLACRGSPEAIAFVDKPLVDEHLHGLRLIRQRFASHSASSSSSLSFSILSSLLATISAFVSAHLSLRTRNPLSSLISKDTSSTTIFRTWHSSWARSERTTWTNSCSLPCASVSSTSCPYSSRDETSGLHLLCLGFVCGVLSCLVLTMLCVVWVASPKGCCRDFSSGCFSCTRDLFFSDRP